MLAEIAVHNCVQKLIKPKNEVYFNKTFKSRSTECVFKNTISFLIFVYKLQNFVIVLSTACEKNSILLSFQVHSNKKIHVFLYGRPESMLFISSEVGGMSSCTASTISLLLKYC